MSRKEIWILILCSSKDIRVVEKNNWCQRGSPNSSLAVMNYVLACTTLMAPYDRTQAAQHGLAQTSRSDTIIGVNRDEEELSRLPLPFCMIWVRHADAEAHIQPMGHST